MAGAALVTGAGRRIGRALALALARAGHPVALHYNTAAAEAASLREEIEGRGGRVVLVRADLTDAAALPRLVGEAAEQLGQPLAVLLNNASLFEDDRIGGLTAERFQAHMDVNLRAPVFLAQAFAAQAPDGASVINIVDQRVLHPNPQFFSYTLAKSALWTATRTLAQALAPRIRVNAIGPGPTLQSIHQSPETFAAEAAHVPLGGGPAPEEIAAAALYLVGASSVTGQMIAVDGGQHLAWRTPDIVSP